MQENLARGLSVVSRAVSNRSLPVLTNVLLKTEDAGLKLTATNLEIGITYWVPGKIEIRRRDVRAGPPADRPGQLRCPAASRSTWSSARARRSTSGAAGSSRTSRASRPTTSRPSRPPASGPITRIAQNVLRHALDETAFAAASDEARPILTGVLARFEGDQLDARGRRQLPDRREDGSRSSTRSRRRASSSRPGPSTSSPASCPTPTTRSRSSSPTPGTSSCSTSRGSISSPA